MPLPNRDVFLPQRKVPSAIELTEALSRLLPEQRKLVAVSCGIVITLPTKKAPYPLWQIVQIKRLWRPKQLIFQCLPHPYHVNLS